MLFFILLAMEELIYKLFGLDHLC